jgi:hypothetical protein
MDNNTKVKLGELISGTKGEDMNQWMARANAIESLLANTSKPGTYDVAGKLDLWRQGIAEGGLNTPINEEAKKNFSLDYQKFSESDDYAQMRELNKYIQDVVNKEIEVPPEYFEKIQDESKRFVGLTPELLKEKHNRLLDILKETKYFNLDDIKRFAGGTPEVTRTGVAEIHKGEAILPAREITAFANAIRMATESMKGFGAGKNVGGVGDNGRTAVDEALIKAANTLSQINIPEKIVLEFPSAIQHQVTFNNGDILSEKISNLIGEKVNQMIQRQITSVISPVDGSTLIG